jgi:acetyl esterase/lipase
MIAPIREGNLDLYLPERQPSAAVLFVHGGPIPEGLTPRPRDWPVFRGYGSAAAERGLVGAVVDHRLHDTGSLRQAGEDIAAGVDRLRAHSGVDSDRIALWFFSGGGVLMGRWLDEPPRWLRCLAASYPFIPMSEELGNTAISPLDSVRRAGDLPIVVTRAGLEEPELADRVDAFVSLARAVGAEITVIDVPNGHHAFDVVDDTDESRTALSDGLDWVAARLVA